MHNGRQNPGARRPGVRLFSFEARLRERYEKFDFSGMADLTRIRMVTQPGKYRNRRCLKGQRSLRSIVVGLSCWTLTCMSAGAQTPRDDAASKDTMGEHYAAAQKALTAKDVAKAETEYKRFISDALRRLASRRAVAGELPKSTALLEEAIELEPDDINLRLDYAGACRASGDLPKAKSAAENALSEKAALTTRGRTATG